MYRVALTGGIAAGKSVVAARLAAAGAVHIDADLLAREGVEPGTAGLAAIETEFGPGVLTADGSLDRAALGAIVFADRTRLAVLNGITHPAVRRLTAERMAEAEERDPHAVVVYDVPLLVEGGGTERFDLVVVVVAPEETRVRRLIEIRGMTPDEAARRIAAQAGDEERLAIADVVIDTGGSLDETAPQVDSLWTRLRDSAAG